MSDGVGGGRKRKSVTMARGAAVVVVALGVAACAAAPTGNSSQASLSGQRQANATAMPSADGAMSPVVQPTTGVMPSAASSTPGHSGTVERGNGPAKPPPTRSEPASREASSVPSASAPSASVTKSASAATRSASAAHSATPTATAADSSAVSLASSCGTQIILQWKQQFACYFTVSGGGPDYGWTTLDQGGIDTDPAVIAGVTDYTSVVNGEVAKYTITGAPMTTGTFTFQVQVMDGTPIIPSNVASITFTIVADGPSAPQ